MIILILIIIINIIIVIIIIIIINIIIIIKCLVKVHKLSHTISKCTSSACYIKSDMQVFVRYILYYIR